MTPRKDTGKGAKKKCPLCGQSLPTDLEIYRMCEEYAKKFKFRKRKKVLRTRRAQPKEK